MPLAGGASDKAGNTYERHLTVLAFIDVLETSATCVRIEVPGKDGAGAEFRQDDADGSVWVQAKRQRDGGPWTIAGMRDVLSAVWDKIRAGDRFRFVSSTGAQELKELVDRAKAAAGWNEFRREFLVGDQVERFERLQTAWANILPEETYVRLQQVEVWLIDEERLEEKVHDRLRALVTGSPSTAAAVLGALVDKSVHRERRATEILARLKAEKIYLRGLSSNVALHARLTEQADAHVAALRGLIRQRELPREEALKIFRTLESSRRVTLAAGAGYGKSTTMVQVIELVRDVGWPVLIVSADRLPDAASIYDLGARLGWPDSPATVLAGLAAGRPALLVIDQLDAVGIVSGRHTDRLALVRDLIIQAESYPHLRVLIGCRQFDLANDRELIAVAGAPGSTVVAQAELDEDVVRRALADAGMMVDLPPKAMELLRVPLHLSIAMEIGQANAEGVARARTITNLFDRFWDAKRRLCRAARGGTDEWPGVIDQLTDWMSERQALTAPRHLLDDVDTQAQVMASNGVISYEGSQVRFFHETFFDYCFARRLLRRGGSLRELMTATEQGLFRRAQVRQLLEYERSADPMRYNADIAWLLTSTDARVHIKTLVVELLGVVIDPGPEEAAALIPILLDSASKLHSRAWLAVRTNSAWFPVLNDAGFWRTAMEAENGQLRNRVLWGLAGILADFAADAGQLVRELPDDDTRHPRWREILYYSALLSKRVPMDLMTQSVEQGMWDGDASQALWDVIHHVAKGDGRDAVEIIRLLFARELGRAVTDDGGSAFTSTGGFSRRSGRQAGQALTAAADAAPADFVDALLPLMLVVMATNARNPRGEDEGIADAVWSGQLLGGRLTVSDDLFTSMQKALQTLAAENPVRADIFLGTLRTLSYKSGWFLLAKGYAANPQYFARAAIDWLITTPGALDVGYMTAPAYVIRELITAVAPECEQGELDRLVAAICDFTPYRERTYGALKYRGSAQLTLLNGVPATLRPLTAQKRLAELQRKFLVEDVPPPRDNYATEVPAPVPAEHAVKMSDTQWLRAIAKHHDAEFKWRDGQRLGNAMTQAPVLQDLCRANPERFARLLLQFTPNTTQSYIDAVLTGLTGAVVDPGLLHQVIEHARLIGGTGTDRQIAALIRSHAAASLPEALTELVCAIAMTSPDPVGNDVLLEDEEFDEPFGHIDMAGLNCTRGSAVATVGALLHEVPTRLPLVRQALEQAASDPSARVRAMAIAAYRSLLDVDLDAAFRYFEVAVQVAPGRLLGSRHVAEFLRVATVCKKHDRVAHVLDRMMRSHNADARDHAVQLVTLAALVDPSLDPQVDELVQADVADRATVIKVCVANLKHDLRKQRAQALIVDAFNDSTDEVQAAASQVFYESLDEQTQTTLLRSFASSQAATNHAEGALHLLGESRAPVPAVALEICERFLREHGASMGDMATNEAAQGRMVVHLILRANAQTNSSDVQRRCLDLIDQLVTQNAIGIDDDLAAIER